jgi:hypothetical protein
LLEAQGNSIIFYAFYTEDGAGDTGLTVTVDVWEVTRAGTATEIVTGGNATEIGDGVYRYLLAAGSVDAEAEYIAVFKTADGDTDQQHIPALWVINRANVEDIDDILTDTGTTIPATITTIDNEIATIDGNVDSILEDTGTTLDGKLDTIDGNVDDILVDTGTDGVKIASGELDGLALEATLTAIKGAGWSDETLKALKDAVDAISVSGATAQEVWEYTTRTLTQSATSITSSVSGSEITDVRGDTWSIEVTDLTLDANLQQFAIKKYASDADSAALLLVDSDTGLLYLNGAAGTAGDASLAYVGTTLTITVAASATAQLPTGKYKYGIQAITAAGAVSEAYAGDFVIQDDYVRTTT